MDEGTLAKFRKRYSTVFTKAHELKSACLDHLRISIVMERVDDGTIYHWNSDPRLTRSDGTTEAWPPPGGLMLTDGERLKNMSPEVLGRERARRNNRRSRRADPIQLDDDDGVGTHSSEFVEVDHGFEEEEHEHLVRTASEPPTPEDLGEDAFDAIQDNFEEFLRASYGSELLENMVSSFPMVSAFDAPGTSVSSPQKANASVGDNSKRASSIARTRMADLDLSRGQGCTAHSSKRPAMSPADRTDHLDRSIRGRTMEDEVSQGSKYKRARGSRSSQVTIPSAIALPESPM